MNDLRRQRGIASELLAAEHLRAHGVTILARNLHCRVGELDLVCLDTGVLVIVEVRQRAGGAFGGAPASVNARKQARIVRATQYFLQRRSDWRNCTIRFDVIAVNGVPDGEHAIVWIKDAFRVT